MKVLAVAALASMTLALTTPAFAEYRGTAEAQQACTPDAFRLCGQFIPDAGQITSCLARQKANLSPACHKVFAGGGGLHRHRQRYADR
jgi:hypothetical protein